MGNNYQLPGLIEINFGFPDFRLKTKLIKKFNFPTVKKLILALPEEVREVGIGGAPLRFDWWEEFIELLENQKGKNFNLVEKISHLSLKKIDLIHKKTRVKLYVEIESFGDIKTLLGFNKKYELAMIGLETACEEPKIVQEITKLGLPYNIEMITWATDRIKTKQIQWFLKRGKNLVKKKCGVAEGKLIGLDMKGNFYPCVALQFPKFCLGNIYKVKFDKIMTNYWKFMNKITCDYCCQARSWNKSKILNKDFLCNYSDRTLTI